MNLCFFWTFNELIYYFFLKYLNILPGAFLSSFAAAAAGAAAEEEDAATYAPLVDPPDEIVEVITAWVRFVAYSLA